MQEIKDILLILKDKEAYNNKVLEKYSNELNCIEDLLGDNEKEMSGLFYLICRHYLYMLDNNPDISIREKDIKFRKKVYKLLKVLGPSLLACNQVVEDREKYADGIDNSIYNNNVSDKPVIYVANHGFRDDILATVLAADRHAYIYWGSLPLFYNTMDGIASSLVGEVVMNRKNPESKKASIEKSIRVLELGTDLIIFPEGGWNKLSNELVLNLWHGVYKISKLGNYDVVPIAHYISDPEVLDKNNLIHTIVDKRIPLYNYEEEEAMELLRDVLSSWVYKMMEEYGRATRSDIMKDSVSSDEKWDDLLSERMKSVARYDSTIEKKSDYRPSHIIRPEEVYDSISNISNIDANNIQMINYAKKTVKERKFADFQRRY